MSSSNCKTHRQYMFDPPNFGLKFFCEPKIFWDQGSFNLPTYLVDQQKFRSNVSQFLFHLKKFPAKNLSMTYNLFLGPIQFFGNKNIFWTKTFGAKKFCGTKQFFRTKCCSWSKSFWTQYFLDQQFYMDHYSILQLKFL